METWKDVVGFEGMYQVSTWGNVRGHKGILKPYVNEKGYCLTDTGRLYGSTSPVIGGMKNLVNNLNMDLLDVIKMSSYNQAHVYGVPSKGSLEIDNDADYTISLFVALPYTAQLRVFYYDADKQPIANSGAYAAN